MLSWLFLMDTPVYGYRNAYIASPPVNTAQNDYVEARLHSLELACAGLWELLKEKNGYTDAELMTLIKQIDQKRADKTPTLGNVDHNVCPKCGHKMLTHNHCKCLWCGADLPTNPF
jgi:ribosomal protein L32